MADIVGGKVKWFDDKRGYGMIERFDGNPDVFIHYTGIYEFVKGERRSLQKHQIVKFSMGPGRRGPEAKEAKAVNCPKCSSGYLYISDDTNNNNMILCFNCNYSRTKEDSFLDRKTTETD